MNAYLANSRNRLHIPSGVVDGGDYDDLAEATTAHCKIHGNEDTHMLGKWLGFTGRDSALLRRKIPSLSREDRWRAVLSRRLDDDDDDNARHRGHVVGVLRGKQLGFTAEECKKVMVACDA